MKERSQQTTQIAREITQEEKTTVAFVEETYTYQYYKEQLTKFGVKICPEAEADHKRSGAQRIVLVHTQGYVPVRPFLSNGIGMDEEERGWVKGGHTDTGGQTFYVLETALAFARMGRQVTILAQRFGDDPVVVKWTEGVDIIRIPPAGIAAKEDEFPFVRKEDLYFTLDRMSVDAVAVARLVGAQGVIGNYADGGEVALNIARELEIPMIFIAHSLGYTKMMRFGFDPADPDKFFENPTEEVRNLNFKERIEAEVRAIKGADYVISNSPEEKEVFKNRYGITVPHHEVLPAGVSDSFYRARENKPSDELAREYGLEPGKYLLGWGRIAQMKNIPAQISILGALREQQPGKYDDVKLVIVGGNPDNPQGNEEVAVAEDLEMTAKYCGMKFGQDVVRIPSQPHEKIAALAAHAIGYIGTQTFEPFGMAAAENLAAGVGITIISQRAGIANWLKDNGGALLIDPENPRRAAREIHEVLSDDGRRQVIVNTGVKVAEQFTWDAIARRQGAILDKIRKGMDE